MEAVSGNHLSRIKKKAKGYDNIMAATHVNKQFNWNDEARTYLAAGMTQVPAASFYGLARALPFFFAAMLIASSIVIDADSLTRHRKLVSQTTTLNTCSGNWSMSSCGSCVLEEQKRLLMSCIALINNLFCSSRAQLPQEDIDQLPLQVFNPPSKESTDAAVKELIRLVQEEIKKEKANQRQQPAYDDSDGYDSSDDREDVEFADVITSPVNTVVRELSTYIPFGGLDISQCLAVWSLLTEKLFVADDDAAEEEDHQNILCTTTKRQ